MNKNTKLEVVEITDKSRWEDFVSRQPHATFLQSWMWGEFQQALGYQVYRRAVVAGIEIKAAYLAVVANRKIARFIYVPMGPLVPWHEPKVLEMVLADLRELAQSQRVDYLRIDPRVPYQPKSVEILQRFGFKTAPSSVHAEVGWLLDLKDVSDEEMLAKMRETTRYLIRKAVKIGVQVTASTNPKDLKTFHKMMNLTVSRQGFVPHSQSYIQKQFEILSKEGSAKLLTASYKGETLASAIIVSYGDTASYVHGASLASKIPASYLLQWEAIRAAKEAGLAIYDFWGIAPVDNPSHPWYGLSLFKKGFGGRAEGYLGTWDYPLSPKYYLVYLIEKFRKITRRL